jgi:hypothetical protein
VIKRAPEFPGISFRFAENRSRKFFRSRDTIKRIFGLQNDPDHGFFK